MATVIKAGGKSSNLTQCQVCLRHFRLRLDGTLVRHGGKTKGNECPGSMKKPNDQIVVNGNTEIKVVQKPVLKVQTVDSIESTVDLFFSKATGQRLYDHIPKQSRIKFSQILSEIINSICDEPINLKNWVNLLLFTRVILTKGPRGG